MKNIRPFLLPAILQYIRQHDGDMEFNYSFFTKGVVILLLN